MRKIFFILFFTWTTFSYGQTFTKLSITTGFTFSGQIKTPEVSGWGDKGIKYGFSEIIEPTILTFGSKKQFDFNTDISFIQKGGRNYSPIYSGMGLIGGEIYPETINYFSFSPTVKANFWKIVFIKVGPRIDIFTSFKNKAIDPSADPRTSKDFNATTLGTTYGIGICTGKKRTKFICEFIGQNDFTKSSYNKASGQTFKNYCYLINFGVTITLKKKDE
jgi:hypothetical protein